MGLGRMAGTKMAEGGCVVVGGAKMDGGGASRVGIGYLLSGGGAGLGGWVGPRRCWAEPGCGQGQGGAYWVGVATQNRGRAWIQWVWPE